MPVIVSESDFNIAEEYERLRASTDNTPGAIVQFVGLVRDFNQDGEVQTLELEHYAGMTEAVIGDICTQAQQRWNISEPTVIHRVGKLQPTDQIVLVAIASSHRADAFAACEFVMDQLKTNATFWKKEKRSGHTDDWLAMKDSDRQRAQRWEK